MLVPGAGNEPSNEATVLHHGAGIVQALYQYEADQGPC